MIWSRAAPELNVQTVLPSVLGATLSFDSTRLRVASSEKTTTTTSPKIERIFFPVCLEYLLFEKKSESLKVIIQFSSKSYPGWKSSSVSRASGFHCRILCFRLSFSWCPGVRRGVWSFVERVHSPGNQSNRRSPYLLHLPGCPAIARGAIGLLVGTALSRSPCPSDDNSISRKNSSIERCYLNCAFA